MLYNFFSDNFEYDECVAKGSCSLPPGISALQEVLLIYIRELAYYILNLRKLGYDCISEENLVVVSLATIISTTDYSNEQLLDIVSNIYFHTENLRNKYHEISAAMGIEYKDLKTGLSLSPQMNLSQVMSLGEKAFLNKYKKNSRLQKSIIDILLTVIKSCALNLSKLSSYVMMPSDYVLTVLNALNLLNKPYISLKAFKNEIKKLVNTDRLLLELIEQEQFRAFGSISQTDVSFSTQAGKAILVSGEDISDLKKVLDSLIGTNIDVYTHGELLIAHAFEEFKNYENLKGHYGTCHDNCVLDFATFPGAILLTKNSGTNIEYLYRGRLFTTAGILPQGVIPINDYDFNELINSAENAKGFAKGQSRSSMIVGYNISDIDDKFNKLKEQYLSGEIERVVVIGTGVLKQGQREYFQKLIKLIPDKSFVLSFSLNLKHNNFLYINVANNRPLVFAVLKKFFDCVPISSENLIFYFARCDITSLSNTIYLKEKGLKHIYLTQCSPNVINPAVISSLDTIYKIKPTSTPEDDLVEINEK